MKIETFKMERWQSEWEHSVKHNLSESGVHPLSIEEFVSREAIEDLFKTKISYIQTDGTRLLKHCICNLYPGTTSENILVTTGSAEANFLLSWSLMEPGDEVLVMLPNFLQMYGLAQAFGAKVRPFFLKQDLNWNPDLDELKRLVTKNTKIIIITHPNNPTGSILSQEARERIIELAEWSDAWIISDEVYQGSEINGGITPTFWGAHKKTIVTSGLSKAYGLPGLRVGWIVGPEKAVRRAWEYKDYTTITISSISDKLAQIALKPQIRKSLLKRTRNIITENLKTLELRIEEHKEILNCVPPKAGAIAFIKYGIKINSTLMADWLRKEKSILICPGDQFGMDGYFRLGLGELNTRFVQGMDIVEQGLKDIQKQIK